MFEEVPDKDTEEKIRSIANIQRQSQKAAPKTAETPQIKVDPDRVQYQTTNQQKQYPTQTDDSQLLIHHNPYAMIRPGGKDQILSTNPLIYTGDSPTYIDPRSNENYYAEDLYQNFETYSKSKKGTPVWEGT